MSIESSHKAVIKQHLEESLAIGVPLDQIHKDLVEAFSKTTRYSLQQVTAVTSWLRSESLAGRRKTEPEWMHSTKKSGEDVDFENPKKIASREWHFRNLADGISAEQRSQMKLLLLPGRNTYDIEAAIKAGFRPQNLITYMRGDDPSANAAYIRNATRFGITHRRIGLLEEELPNESEVIDCAYLDFFGQYCPAYAEAITQLPIPRSSASIRLSINVMASREHASTSERLRSIEHLSKNYDSLAGIADEAEAHQRAVQLLKEGADNSGPLKAAREASLRSLLFSGVGVANSKNWLLKDEMKKIAQCCGEYPDFDDLSAVEQFNAFNRVMRLALQSSILTTEEFQRNGLYADLSLLGLATRLALVNSPQIKKVSGPDRYISPQSNTPFVSYASELATHGDFYAKFTSAMSFFLKVYTQTLPHATKNKPGLSGAFRLVGPTSKRELVYSDIQGNLIASIGVEELMESAFELSKHESSPDAMGYSDQEWSKVKGQKFEAVMQKLDQQKLARAIEKPAAQKRVALRGMNASPLARNTQRIGRNAPCPCGSGQKFKKCCMGH